MLRGNSSDAQYDGRTDRQKTTNYIGNPSWGGSPGAWYASMSACIISVTFASCARNSSVGIHRVGGQRACGNGARTSICFRAEQSLLLASKCDELDVGMELEAELLDSACDREQRDDAGTIVITTGCLQHRRVTRRSQ